MVEVILLCFLSEYYWWTEVQGEKSDAKFGAIEKSLLTRMIANMANYFFLLSVDKSRLRIKLSATEPDKAE